MPLSNRLRNSVRDAVLSIAAYFLLGPGHYSVVARRVAEKRSGAHDRRGRTCVVMSQGLVSDGNDGCRVAGLVDSVDHPVCASTGAVPIGQWRSESPQA